MKRDHMYRKGEILIVDDEPNTLKVISAILTRDGYSVHESPDCDSAIQELSRTDIDAVITDMKMPEKDGTELFDHIQQRYSDIPVIFLTAYGTIESAVQAITGGAFYYFVKPPDFHKLKEVVDRAVEKKRANGKRPEHAKQCHITGRSEKMAKITQIIESVADGASNVLITGEPGTGKAMAARALHYGGQRKSRPFIHINCGALSREALESELFGFEKCPSNGDSPKKAGRLERAGEGTVFLGEIGELDISIQAKLLRVLQDGEIEWLGGVRKIETGFRLIASTNRDLSAEVKKGNFREDLFYRINVVQIKLPSLRERMDDLPLLAMEFMKEFCLRENKKLFLSAEVLDILNRYSWPGNVRQLRNVIERAVVLARQENITPNELPAELLVSTKKRHGLAGQLKTLKDLEMQAVRKALSQFDGNKSRAARALGISRKSFYKKLIDH